MDAQQFRSDTIAAVKQIIAATGMTLTSANYSLANCYDDRSGNSWQAEVTGTYNSGDSLHESQATIARWTADLKRHGWAHQPGTITHGGIVISRDGGTVDMDYQDRSYKQPPPPFTYTGPCHPLPKSDSDGADIPAISSILSDISQH